MQYIDSYYWGALIYDGVNKEDIAIHNSLWLGDNLADALGESTFLEKMQELAALDKKYIIYADHNSFAEIVATWLKSVTNMDQAAYEKWVDIYIWKRLRNGAENLDSLKTALKAAWPEASQIDLSTLDATLSLEFLLPSVWVDANHSAKANCKSLISDFVKRTYEDYIIEGKNFVDTNIYKQSIQTLFGGTGKTHENYIELPRLAVFANSYFNESGSRIPGGDGKINLANVPSSDFEAIETATNIAYSVFDGFGEDEMNWSYLPSVAAGELTDEEFALVINEIKSANNLPWIPFDLESTINFEGISYLQDLAVNNNIAELTKYTLR
jgi:hypothetical protein